MIYRKTCRNCGKEFEDTDYTAIASLAFCKLCFEALPDVVEQVNETNELAQKEYEAFDDSACTEDRQGNSNTDAFGFPAASSSSLGGEQFANSVSKSNSASFCESTVRAEEAPTAPAITTHELHWIGTNRASVLPVVLPDSLDGGYVGRDPIMCDAAIDKPTISRIQFAYRNAIEGHGIEITNYSQFGTWVNGQLLQRNETAIAPLGSTIEMGGFSFELRERDE